MMDIVTDAMAVAVADGTMPGNALVSVSIGIRAGVKKRFTPEQISAWERGMDELLADVFASLPLKPTKKSKNQVWTA